MLGAPRIDDNLYFVAQGLFHIVDVGRLHNCGMLCTSEQLTWAGKPSFASIIKASTNLAIHHKSGSRWYGMFGFTIKPLQPTSRPMFGFTHLQFAHSSLLPLCYSVQSDLDSAVFLNIEH